MERLRKIVLASLQVLLHVHCWTIQGQEWVVSTGIPVSLEVSGSNLTSSRRLRILAPNSSCDEAGGASGDLPFLVNCTSGCTQAREDTSLALHTCIFDAAKVAALRVQSAHKVEVEFDVVPGIRAHDRIILGSEVQCRADCAEEHITSLRGLATGGHEVAATPKPRRFVLQTNLPTVGGQLPSFVVSAGSWDCTNRASTQKLWSSTAAAGLRVCAQPEEGVGGTSHEIGTLSFVNAAEMPVAWLHPTATAVGAPAPVAVSFMVGLEQSAIDATGGMRLVLHFATGQLQPLQVDGALVLPNTTNTEREQSQATCGRLIKELWANDSHFPMPRGCSYRMAGEEGELQLSFGSGNDLRPGVAYQIIFLAILKLGATTANSGLELRLMGSDDNFVHELGKPKLNRPLTAGAEFPDPRLAAEVVGGSNGLAELSEDQGPSFDLRISPEVGEPIPSGSLLRVFLSPLTAWASWSSSCSATSELWDVNATHRADLPCEVSSVVAPLAFNLLHIALPNVSMAAGVRLEIHVGGLAKPSGGFFPEQLAAELLRPDATKPHYVRASGSLWAWLPRNSSIAGIVSCTVCGNMAPFRSETNNLLVRFALAATLRSVVDDDDSSGEASLSLTAPDGYILKQADPPPTASVMSSALESRWSCSGRSCVYTLTSLGAIWAGSWVDVWVTLSNPESPLDAHHPDNVWQLRMQAAGYHTTSVPAPVVHFSQSHLPDADVELTAGVPVLGMLSHTSIQPSRFAASPANGSLVPNELQVFFMPEQSVWAGRLVLQMPDGFTVPSTNICSDLHPSLYSADGEGRRVLVLPGIWSCTVESRSRLSIALAGALLAGKYYGFQAQVFNPRKFSSQEPWVLMTLSGQGYAVDASATIGLSPPGADDGFDVYERELTEVTHRYFLEEVPVAAAHGDVSRPLVSMEVVYPSPSEQDRVARVQVLLRTGVEIWTSFRATAPSGYEWLVPDEELHFEGTTADLPGLPLAAANVLRWPAARYLQNETYGFALWLRMPPAPLEFNRAFFFEFGYDQSWSTGGRVLAGRVDAPEIPSLRNAWVEPVSRVPGQATVVTFQVETTTPLPPGGALIVRSPAGVGLSTPCKLNAVPDLDLLSARARVPQQLPNNVSCITRPFPAAAAGSQVNHQQIDLLVLAGAAGIPAGLYRFEVAGRNAVARAEGREDRCSSSHHCWTFLSVANANAEPQIELDWRSISPGHHKGDAMPEARLLPTMGRNDRPLESNSLTFVFRLLRDVNSTGARNDRAIFIRGPAGFVLKQDCFVETLDIAAATAVRAPVQSCEAELSTARLTAISPGFKAGILYAFGVKVLTNPPRTPSRNLWSLEVEGEVSSPFRGFSVQTFRLLEVEPLTCATGFVWPNKQANVANLTFQPETSQSPQGHASALLVHAPPGFTFVNGSGSCEVLSHFEVEVDEGSMEVCSQPSSEGCDCELQAASVLVIKLREVSTKLVGGQMYHLGLRFVALASARPEASWKLESFDDIASGVKLDVGQVTSFRLCEPLAHLAIGRYDPSSAGPLVMPSQDAEAFLPDLLLSVAFAHTVLPGDTLQIKLPSGYRTECSETGWLQGPLAGLTPDWTSAKMPAHVEVSCTAGEPGEVVEFQMHGEEQLPAGERLTLRLMTANPRRIFGEQYWQVGHLRRGEVLAGGAWRTWEVFLQLSEAVITLASAAVGQRYAVVDVRFKAEGDAEVLRLQPTGPMQIDFTNVSISRGQILRSEINSVLLVSLNMKDGDHVGLRIYNARLPKHGGRIIFDLEIRNRTGSRIARKHSIDSGSQIPGHIELRSLQLRNEYAPNLTQSQWPAQLGGRTVLEIEVRFLENANPFETLRISGKPFVMLQGNFRLVVVDTGTSVPMSSSKTDDGVSFETLGGQGLQRDIWYRATATVLAPATLPRRVFWGFEVLGAGLPSSLGSAEGTVHFVPCYEVEITAVRSPPLAVVAIELAVSLHASSPTRLTLVAPAGFRFTENCLSGPSDVVARCSPTQVNEQEAAELVPIKAFFTDLQELSLQVRTPAAALPSSTWLLVGWTEGEVVGWGEDKLGIGVVQMRSVAVIYPASPDTRSELVVRLRLRDELLPGGILQLLNPPEFVLNCSGPQLQEISLPIEGCTAEAGSLVLRLSSGLVPGTYAFGVGAQVPPVAPKTNMFSLLVFGPSGLVQDATTVVKGQQLQSELHVDPRPLRWTAAEAGQASSVVMGFEVRQQVKRDLVESVLLTLAENFEHSLETPQGIEILNPSFPLSRSHGATSWADIRKEDRILIHVDLARPLPPGQYDFRIPITVPEELSAFNVWQLTLCSEGRAAEPCSVESPRALATFPAAGFSLASRMPERPQIGQGTRLSIHACGYFLVLFLL